MSRSRNHQKRRRPLPWTTDKAEFRERRYDFKTGLRPSKIRKRRRKKQKQKQKQRTMWSYLSAEYSVDGPSKDSYGGTLHSHHTWAYH